MLAVHRIPKCRVEQEQHCLSPVRGQGVGRSTPGRPRPLGILLLRTPAVQMPAASLALWGLPPGQLPGARVAEPAAAGLQAARLGSGCFYLQWCDRLSWLFLALALLVVGGCAYRRLAAGCLLQCRVFTGRRDGTNFEILNTPRLQFEQRVVQLYCWHHVYVTSDNHPSSCTLTFACLPPT